MNDILIRLISAFIPTKKRRDSFRKKWGYRQGKLHLLYSKQIITKLSIMKDNLWRINNCVFYVPNYPLDSIQSAIVDTNNFYDIDTLQELDEYIPDNAVICDIGSNIGNHTLYWALKRNARFIYAFEPIPSTYEILEKNIQLNYLQNVVTSYNFGLSNKEINASITLYNGSNIGATFIHQASDGHLKLKTLDSLSLDKKIDLLKIDVEGHEIEALQGSIETIKLYKPSIFVESFGENIEKIKQILLPLEYRLVKEFNGENYLFINQNKM